MALTVATIYFRDVSDRSRRNKDLCEFLKRNMEATIKRGRLSFAYIIVTEAKIPDLKRQGLGKFPSMMLNNVPYIDVPTIIEGIRTWVKSSKSAAPIKTEDEIVRDYMIMSMGEVKKGPEGQLIPEKDDDNGGWDYMAASAKVMEHRRNNGMTTGDNGGENPVARRIMAPGGTDRNAERDDDNFEPQRQNNGRQNNGGRVVLPPRHDNLANPGMDDARQALNNVIKNEGSNKQDDAMMEALLNRLGGGD